MSATASGKTEAACAPLIERFYDSKDHWTILYVTPTRALVNDLYFRLSPAMDRLSLRLARRTGDHHDDPTGANILLTTPESFDSLLCRGRTNNPSGHHLSNVRAIVLDEIHLLHGNPRGEQLRWLLERLKLLRKQAMTQGWANQDDVQLITMSAKIPNREEIVTTYLGQGEIAVQDGGRDIESVATIEPTAELAISEYIKSLEAPEKVLVFVNSRRRADDLGATLKESLSEYQYSVYVHHGSLSQPERQKTEQALRTSDRVIVVATSSLEIGIDIGDVDLVVLDGPAPDIRAFLQRIGRGNRRTDMTRVMTCSWSYLELIVHSAMLKAAQEGWLGSCEFGPQYAVARQQIASYIFQGSRISRDRNSIDNLLAICSEGVLRESLVESMLVAGDLIEDSTRVRMNEDWQEKASNGQIHSNIDTVRGATVVDADTGREIAVGLRPESIQGSRIGVAGTAWVPKSWDNLKLEVKASRENGLVDGNWGYVNRRWHKGADQPESVKRYLGISEFEWPAILVDGRQYVFHFGGSRRKLVLQMVGKKMVHRANEWYISLPFLSEGKPLWAREAEMYDGRLIDAENVDRLERELNRPRANQSLSLEVRLSELEGWLRLDEELKILKDAVWNDDLDGETSEVLAALIRTIESPNSELEDEDA